MKIGRYIVLLGLLFCVSIAKGQNYNFFNGSAGTWHDAGNWSFGTIPTASDTVFIPAFSTVTVDNNASCAGLILVFGSQLIMNASKLKVLNWSDIESNTSIAFNTSSELILGGELNKEGVRVMTLNGLVTFSSFPDFPVFAQ